jgi:hypothetical protein
MIQAYAALVSGWSSSLLFGHYAGSLVLLEAPVATVIRTQYARTSCHTCAKELPSPADPSSAEAAAAPYKRYCSRACAAADVRAGLAQDVHRKISEVAAQADVRLLCCTIPVPL